MKQNATLTMQQTAGTMPCLQQIKGEVLNIPCDILEFLNVEIPVYNDACLASTFYKEWVEYCGNKAKLNYCMGYKVPLFLGGEDDISNLEEIDMEVYWSVTGQLNSQC